MSGGARAAVVVAVVAAATLGEGGASASSLLVQHLLLAVSVAVFAVLRAPSRHAPSREPSIAWLAFAGCAAVGAMFAPYAYAAWLVLIEILAFGTLVWVAAGEPLAVARVLPPAIALLATAHGTAAVVQKLSGNARPASTFFNPNHLAAWPAAAALFLAGTFSRRSASVRARAVVRLAIGLALAGIFVTGSRGAVLGLAAGAVALVATSWSRALRAGSPRDARRGGRDRARVGSRRRRVAFPQRRTTRTGSIGRRSGRRRFAPRGLAASRHRARPVRGRTRPT